nr:hypothetical protein [Paracoccus saliphilus]
MIGTSGVARAGLLAFCAIVAAGCASSPNRMPPAAPVDMAMAPAVPPVTGYPVAPGYAPAGIPAPAYPAPAYATLPYPAAPAPVPAPFPVAADPVPVAANGITGLEERKPDLCGASKFASAKGQPGSTIPGLGISKAYRVVEYRGIEPQEYNPNRIVFRLDPAGIITNIDCG